MDAGEISETRKSFSSTLSPKVISWLIGRQQHHAGALYR
jgi:hypothetical protein